MLVSPQDAIQLQKQLTSQIVLKNSFGSLDEIKTIAAFDLALELNPRFISAGTAQGQAYAVSVLFSFPELEIINRYYYVGEIKFPYIPGLLSFRECSLYLALIEQHNINADIYIFDGQGVAHPRRLGIASHMGLMINKPTIGCAKSLLYGEYSKLAEERFSTSKLLDPKSHELIGTVLRTKAKCNPVFISPGYLIDHPTSLEIITKFCDGYRIPKATRLADQYSKEVKKLVKVGDILVPSSRGVHEVDDVGIQS